MQPLSSALALLLLASGGAPLRAAPPPRTAPGDSLKVNKLLHPGKYRLSVAGVLCNVCTRLIVEEVLKVPDVRAASFDFEEGYLRLTVGKERKVRLTEIERALRMASRKLDLETRFELTDVQYVP